MQIKKYTGLSLKEASEKMKKELGVEAVILSSRMLQNTPGKKIYEITAGIEDEYDRLTGLQPQRIKAESSPNFAEELAKKISIAKSLADRQRGKAAEPEKREKAEPGSSVEIKKVIETLFNRELNKNIVSSVVSELKKYKSFLHSSNIESYILTSLSSMIPVHNFSFKKKGQPNTIALVGPTGVGKTTCIAKLAVISKIIHNLDVGLISIDTYRLGAIDQLRIFSEISNIDMLVAYEPEEMPKLYESLKHKDIIFIDTAGRSQRNAEQLTGTKKYLDKIKIDETYLVMSSTSGTRTLYDVAQKFKVMNYNAAIFTKIDEAAAYGNIVNVAAGYNMPVVYLSNGQVIPDDIISADADFIANMVYKGQISK